MPDRPGRHQDERGRAARVVPRVRSARSVRPTVSANLVRCVLDAVTTPIIAVRVDGEIVYCNVAAGCLLGRAVTDVTVGYLDDLVAPRAALDVRGALVAGITWSGAVELRGPADERVVLEMRVSPFTLRIPAGVTALATFVEVPAPATWAATASHATPVVWEGPPAGRAAMWEPPVATRRVRQVAISVNRASAETTADREDTERVPVSREEIRRAVANDEITVHYQPIVRLDDGTRVGAEALARWNRPTRGLLPPAAFIPTAERLGLIGELGEVVLEKACAEAQRWRAEGHDLYLSVNISARQLADGCLPTRLADIMARTDTHPAQLWLEITETAVVEDLDQACAAVSQIAELGVRVSIDDFGTGWASLTYLREFPVHALKIDRVFVNGLGSESSDLAIVSSVIALGHELDLDVIAEGIETSEQRAVLRELGCESGQGYFFGRPVPPEEL